MKLNKALNRDRKKAHKRDGMQVDNRNIFILEKKQREREEELRRRKEKAEKEKLVLDNS